MLNKQLPGLYVIAVSGGVDSVVLLDMLAKEATKHGAGLSLLVAHFDHGIRPDSADDCLFVQNLAAGYGLPFVFDSIELGPGASEAAARKARYAFLEKVREAAHADAIITAHHQDDVLETIIINWLRGTKSRGLSSLRSTDEMIRPLLTMSKAEILEYAKAHKLSWREDSTNDDESYLRNYIRKNVMPKLDASARKKILAHSERAAKLNEAITRLTQEYLAHFADSNSLQRGAYRELPGEVSKEVLAEWLRIHTSVVLTGKMLERIDTAIRTGRNNSMVDIEKGMSFKLLRETVQLVHPQ